VLSRPMRHVAVVQSNSCKVLLAELRDVKTECARWQVVADRLCVQLAEEAMACEHLVSMKEVETPCGKLMCAVSGSPSEFCAVSIVRSGDILMPAVRRTHVGISCGKILLQRDENDSEKRPVWIYQKFPHNISELKVLLCDPMLATGGSAIKAIECLLKAGVEESNITFINVIASQEGIRALHEIHPAVYILTVAIDPVS